MKVIALKVINKTQPGEELNLPDNVAKVLVLLGNARYADNESATVAATPEKPRAVRTRRAPATGASVGTMTKPPADEA